MPTQADEKAPHPVDLHIGRAIRLRRKLLGVTQSALAGAIGLTFQQVQKYERGVNRVSASMLWEITGALDCDPGDLYAGLQCQPAGKARPDPRDMVGDFLGLDGGLELAACYAALPAKYRRAILVGARILCRP